MKMIQPECLSSVCLVGVGVFRQLWIISYSSISAVMIVVISITSLAHCRSGLGVWKIYFKLD